MPLPADYHMHTPLCRHATGQPTEYAAHALALGLTEIGFSDHAPMRQDNFDHWRMRLDQLDEYVDQVRQAQREHPGLTIKLALEVDFLPGHEEWIRELAARHPWDYFIGSVHYVAESWAIDDPSKIAEWKQRDPDAVWTIYFERLIQAAESRLFDVIGHADLPKKFGFLPQRDCSALVDRFFKAAQATRLAVELNTGGLRKECREIYPGPAFMQRMAQFQIPITFGSDAHAPGEVGLNWPEAVAAARQAGYTQWLRFTRRQREAVAL